MSERDAGKGWSDIARTLTAEGVPTAHGATTWRPSTVQYANAAARRD